MTTDTDLPGMLAVAKGIAEQKFPHTMDAQVWATEFNNVLLERGNRPFDPGWLIGWFANAIMAGYDTANAKHSRAEATREWQPMHTAPLDGTEIEILFRHFEYWTCLKVSGKEKAEAEYQAVQKAHWIDHNGGGWTWHGMAGSPMGWRFTSPRSCPDCGRSNTLNGKIVHGPHCTRL